VRDETHHVAVPFRATYQAAYGFIGDFDGDGVISWRDFDYIEGIADVLSQFGFCQATGLGAGNNSLMVAQPIVMATSTDGNAGAGAMPTTGTGFGFLINGQRYIMELPGGALPPDGTVWTLRSYIGQVTAANDESATPSGYSFRQRAVSPAITGLQLQFTISANTQLRTFTENDLELVHTVPDPYYVTSAFEITPGFKILKFVNLPPQAIIRIYSVSGILVDMVEHNDVGLGGEAIWDVRNRNNQFVASGVYFYHVETPEGFEKIGRFTVVNTDGLAIRERNDR
jgi:hypothetical protein